MDRRFDDVVGHREYWIGLTSGGAAAAETGDGRERLMHRDRDQFLSRSRGWLIPIEAAGTYSLRIRQLGLHRLAESEVREAIQELGHLLIVEGPNNTIRLDAFDVPAFAVCSNRLKTAQADKIAYWCRELGVVAVVLLDCNPEGEAGAQQTVMELAVRCPVRFGWSREMLDGRFKNRQPENSTADEWMEIQARLVV